MTNAFDSWLRIVEERFGVNPMTARDTRANDMLNAFDFSQMPRPPVILNATREGSPYPYPLQSYPPKSETQNNQRIIIENQTAFYS